MKLNNLVQKICCFYASDWHLTVMLLPYINKKIEENVTIHMRCENSIEEKMKILLNKLDIKNKKEIEEINWNNQVAENDWEEKDVVYIISGCDSYIDRTNKIIEQFYKNRDNSVKIINCYEIKKDTDLDKIIRENKYKKILNTSGENLINSNYIL